LQVYNLLTVDTTLTTAAALTPEQRIALRATFDKTRNASSRSIGLILFGIVAALLACVIVALAAQNNIRSLGNFVEPLLVAAAMIGIPAALVWLFTLKGNAALLVEGTIRRKSADRGGRSATHTFAWLLDDVRIHGLSAAGALLPTTVTMNTVNMPSGTMQALDPLFYAANRNDRVLLLCWGNLQLVQVIARSQQQRAD
jgi:membrane protease YdiL (CAAX protease family)